MTASRFTPPIKYLQAASRASLQSFELARLNHAANLREEIAALIDQWIQETAEAMLARWMLEHQQSLQGSSSPSPEIMHTFIDPGSRELPELSAFLPNVLPTPPRLASPRISTKATISRRDQKLRQSAVG